MQCVSSNVCTPVNSFSYVYTDLPISCSYLNLLLVFIPSVTSDAASERVVAPAAAPQTHSSAAVGTPRIARGDGGFSTMAPHAQRAMNATSAPPARMAMTNRHCCMDIIIAQSGTGAPARARQTFGIAARRGAGAFCRGRAVLGFCQRAASVLRRRMSASIWRATASAEMAFVYDKTSTTTLFRTKIIRFCSVYPLSPMLLVKLL